MTNSQIFANMTIHNVVDIMEAVMEQAYIDAQLDKDLKDISNPSLAQEARNYIADMKAMYI